MKRIAKQSSRGSGPGSRLGLAVLAAAIAAFMLVPVAAQAEFTTGVETLKINITGTGAGEVITSVGEVKGSPPINCTYASPGPQAGVCEDLMTNANGEYEGVLVSALPAPGSEFVKWIEENGEFFNCAKHPTYRYGACEPFVEPPGEFEETTELGAEFKKETGELLTVNVAEGNGTVVSNPAGINCDEFAASKGFPSCWKSYAANAKVTLTASPAAGYLFKSWKGCDKTEGEFGVNGRQCTVKMSQAKSVSASFIPAYKLTAFKAGSGMLTTSPAGVNCGYTCTSAAALYKEGALTLKEKPNKHFHFVEFTGTGSAEACNGVTTETCVISTFNSNSTMTANFAEDSKYTLSYSAKGGGQGAVTTKPAGINCGYTCTASSATFYNAEGEIEVKVKLNKGTTSVKWTTGAGTGNCENGKTVSLAEFTCKVPAGTTALVAEYQ